MSNKFFLNVFPITQNNAAWWKNLQSEIREVTKMKRFWVNCLYGILRKCSGNKRGMDEVNT